MIVLFEPTTLTLARLSLLFPSGFRSGYLVALVPQATFVTLPYVSYSCPHPANIGLPSSLYGYSGKELSSTPQKVIPVSLRIALSLTKIPSISIMSSLKIIQIFDMSPLSSVFLWKQNLYQSS